MVKTQDTLRATTRTELHVGQDEVRDVRLFREILPKTGRSEL